MNEVQKRIVSGDFWVVVCTIKVVKMKEHLPFFRECSSSCIEDRVAVDRVA